MGYQEHIRAEDLARAKVCGLEGELVCDGVHLADRGSADASTHESRAMDREGARDRERERERERERKRQREGTRERERLEE